MGSHPETSELAPRTRIGSGAAAVHMPLVLLAAVPAVHSGRSTSVAGVEEAAEVGDHTGLGCCSYTTFCSMSPGLFFQAIQCVQTRLACGLLESGERRLLIPSR